MSPIEFIILALGSWRLARLITDGRESGPWGILSKFRYWAGVRYDENSIPYGTNEFAVALNCIRCFGLWAAAIVIISWAIFPTITYAVCLPFAISGAMLLFERDY